MSDTCIYTQTHMHIHLLTSESLNAEIKILSVILGTKCLRKTFLCKTQQKLAIVHLDFMLNSDAIVTRMKYRKVQNANCYSAEAWRAPRSFKRDICFNLAVPGPINKLVTSKQN